MVEWFNFQDDYYVGDNGVIRKGDRIIKGFNKILGNKVNKTNTYRYFKIQNKYERKDFAVHRLVALAFCENLNNFETVDHIDGDTLNNNANNLRWANRSIQNKNRQTHSNTGYKFIGKIKRKNKEIYQIQIPEIKINNTRKTLEEAIERRNELIQLHNLEWRESYDKNNT
jgi:hypothetical protein